MAEGDRLGHLQVGETRQRRGGMGFGQVEQGALIVGEQGKDLVNRVAQPQADIGGHLVVAAAAGVQAFAGVADQRGEAFFDIEVDIFVLQRPGELAALDFVAHLPEPALDVGEVIGADDALARQHPGVRQRAADVLCRHALIEEDGCGVTHHQCRYRFGKSAGPRLAGVIPIGLLICHNAQNTL